MNSNYFKKGILGSVLLLLLLAGCSPAAETDSTVEEEPEFPVVVQELNEGSLGESISFTGRAEAHTIVHVAPKVGGKITSLPVSVGSVVSQGQVLMTLDTDDLRNGVKQSEAALLSAKANLENARSARESAITQAQHAILQAEQGLRDAQTNMTRVQGLFDSGVVPLKDLEQAQTALANAELQYKGAQDTLANAEKTAGITVAEQGVQQSQVALEIAQSNLANATVTAPQAGTIAEVNVEMGELANPQAPAITIVQLNPMKVSVDIPESYLPYFTKGKEVELSFEAINYKTTGIVDVISPLNTAQNKGYPVQITVNNPDNVIMHGMVSLVSPKQAINEVSGLLVPSNALVKVDGKDVVYILEGDRAVQKEVRIVEQGSAGAIIEGEISAGAKLIIKGQTLINDGAKVRVVQE